jgi:hypothetical protein
MRRFAISVLAASVLSGAAVALAASPKKGGVYDGIKPGLVKKEIVLRVSKDGKSAFASLRCADTLSSTISNVSIHKGSFSGTKRTGSLVIWTLSGRFTSKTQATAHAFLHAVCDGGSVNLTLTLAH